LTFRLSVERLVRIFPAQGGAAEPTRAVDGVDFVATAGEITALVGPSGCGKSTLLAMIAGLEPCDSGAVRAGAVTVTALSAEKSALWRRAHVGFLFQDAGLVDRMRVIDNVMLPMIYRNAKPRDRRAAAIAALERLGLGNMIERRVDGLSGGERRRVGFARILADPRPLLICDEPSAGLDADNTEEIRKLLQIARADGACIILATHDPELVTVADKVLPMRRGQLVAPDLALRAGAQQAAAAS